MSSFRKASHLFLSLHSLDCWLGESQKISFCSPCYLWSIRQLGLRKYDTLKASGPSRDFKHESIIKHNIFKQGKGGWKRPWLYPKYESMRLMRIRLQQAWKLGKLTLISAYWLAPVSSPMYLSPVTINSCIIGFKKRPACICIFQLNHEFHYSEFSKAHKSILDWGVRG